MVSLALLAGILVWMASVMTVSWLVQRAANNSGWIDVFWTYGTGVAGIAAAAWPVSGADSARQILVAVIIALWAARLGTYILLRVSRSRQEDARYARFKAQWGTRYQAKLYWLILPQAAITAVMMASVAAAARRPMEGLDWRDALGVAILLIAIGGETLSDYQLARFKRQNQTKGAICEAGLWGWSRHPNYFFEWLGWLAFPAIGLTADPVSWLTLLAPVAMFIVLRFITGVPPLEATMLESRGQAFRDYQARTSVFLPLPPKGA